MMAHPLPLLRPHPPPLEPPVLEHDLLVAIDQLDRSDLSDTTWPFAFVLTRGLFTTTTAAAVAVTPTSPGTSTNLMGL